MLVAWLRIAWRNIRRNKFFALVSMSGLAIGSVACLLIWLICSYEFSFDNSYPNRDRIYRIISHGWYGNHLKRAPNVKAAAPAILRKGLTGVDALTDITPYEVNAAVRLPDHSIRQFDKGDIVFTDPEYFAIFQRDWLAGNPAEAMTAPYRVVLTESRARKYFGPASPDKWIGKTVIYNDSLDVSVAGIVRDQKGNTDFPFTDLISFSTIHSNASLKNFFHPDEWRVRSPNVWCFALLSKGTPPSRIDAELDRLGGNDPITGNKIQLQLQPFAEIHFATDMAPGDDIRKASLPALYGMMGIAAFILLIAAINFINLSTAQSLRRAKEIGVRKVLGSSRTALIGQFLTESFLLALIAMIAGLLLIHPALHWFGDYIPQGMPFEFFSVHVLGFSLVLTVVITLGAGFYPALVLAGYLPAVVLRGTDASLVNTGGRWRKGLIVFQFTIALLFIMATFIVGKQIDFMLHSDPGFQSKAILTTSVPWRDSVSKVNVLKERISRISGVGAIIAEGAQPMGLGRAYMDTLTYKGRTITQVPVFPEAGDEGFLPFYQMRLLAGRNLLHSDSLTEFVVNETASMRLGFRRPDEAVGQLVYWHGKAYPIVGVVADFHETSFRQPIEPLYLGHIPGYEKELAIRVKSGRIAATLDQLEKAWKSIYPDRPFEYNFLDEEIVSFYNNERKTAHLLSIATGTAILVSCVGLFGLALFVTRQRTKEIAIRKVLGAGVRQVLALLVGSFLRPIVLAFCIAVPVVWLFMQEWLQQYAFRTSINLFVLLCAAAIIFAAALATVTIQTVRSALANPVDGLRED